MQDKLIIKKNLHAGIKSINFRIGILNEMLSADPIAEDAHLPGTLSQDPLNLQSVFQVRKH